LPSTFSIRRLPVQRLPVSGVAEGAQATLSLRAVYVNDLWDQFIAYRVATKQTRLYGKDTQHATAA
jgi:hypothetical protein